MEVVLIGALIVKYDVVASTFRNLEPFLNIERNSEYLYRMVIVLKCMYVFYAMENAVPKFWMLMFTGLSKGCFIYMKTEFAVYAYVTLIFHCVNICFAQMALTGLIAITCESFEFLLDIYVLFCSFYYAAQTYKREMHKLVAIFCLSVGIGFYVDNIQSDEKFRFGVYYLLAAMCLATVVPFLPRRKKYGHRLVFYYVLLTIWIAYKGDMHCNNEGLSVLHGSKSDVCNITQHIYESQHCSLNETLESFRTDDISSYGKMMEVDLKGKKLAGGTKYKEKSSVNKKEASCKYDLIPDIIFPMEMYSTKQENSEIEIKEMTDEIRNPEIGRIEAIKYDTESMTDMKVENTEQGNSETEIKERTDGTTNQEIGRIEAIEYDTESMTDVKEDSIRQENLETEIKERTDGTIQPETEGTEVTEKDKASTESYKLTLNFDDEKNLLEENSNLEEKMFTESVQHWTENPFEDDEIFSVNLFQMNETNGYAEYMDDPSDTTESFPVTETSVDDIDYEIEKRLGNVERIDNETRPVRAYEELEFKIPTKPEQSHQSDEFVAGTQPFYDNESDGKSTIAKIEIKKTKLQATETYVVKEKDAIKKVVPAQALIGEPTKVKQPETGLLELAESRVSGEIGFHSINEFKNEENYLQNVNWITTAEDTKTRNLEAQESVSKIVVEETDAKTSEAVLSKALDNPNKVDEIQNKWTVLRETDESKVDSSEALQATESKEYLTTKSKETYKSQSRETFMETKATKLGEMTEDEYSEPTVFTATKDCERKFALTRYPRASDYEICKPIPFANNHEISKDSDYSKFTTFGTQKSKTISQTPENTDKKTGLKLDEDYIDSADRVISSNAPDSYFSNKDGDELRDSHLNVILSIEKTEYESVVFAEREAIPASYQTSENERRDLGENNFMSYSNEANAIEIKPVRNYEAKKTESARFKGTETKETKQHRYGPTEISNTNAEDIKMTSPGSPLINKVKSSKKNEPENININTIKSQVFEIDPLETNKGSTAEAVLPKTLPPNHESEANGIKVDAFSDTKTSKSYSSHTIEQKSEQIEYNTDASESENDSHTGATELENTETNYFKEREMEVIQVADPKESQHKYRKSKIEEAFTESPEFKTTKSNLRSTAQPKPNQDARNSVTNKHEYEDNNPGAPTLETKASYSNTKAIKSIKVVGSEKSRFPTKSSETSNTKDTHTRETELEATKNGVPISKPFQQDIEDPIENELKFNIVSDPSEKELEFSNATTKLQTTKTVPRTIQQKQFKEREVSDFTASENENKVRHPRIEELEIPKASDASAGEIQPIEAVGPKSSPKSTKARGTRNAYERNELGDTKTGVPRTFERKPTKQGEFRDSFANDLNNIDLRQENGLETTTVSYVATEIELIDVSNIKYSHFKPTKSGDVETCKSEPTISRENIQPHINKADELEGIKFETTEHSNNFISVSKNLPILVEAREYGYPNKASDSKEFGYKARKIDNLSASEYISITSDYIESRNVRDVSEIEVPESREKVKEVDEFGKQNIEVNPSGKIESKENAFHSHEPTMASVPHELKPEKITNNGEVPKFDLSVASKVRPNENKLLDGNGKLIQPNIKTKHPVDNEKSKAYKTEDDDTNGSEESQPEKRIESVEDGTSEIAEMGFQEAETTKRVFEHPVTGNKKSETSRFSKTEFPMSKSEATSIKEYHPVEDEFGKAEMGRSEKMSSNGNVPPHWLGSNDMVATEIREISATEAISERPDIYKTAETFQGKYLAGETIADKSEKSQMNFDEAVVQEVFQSAEIDSVDTS